MYFLAAFLLVYVDVMVMSSAYAMTLTGALGGDKSELLMLIVWVRERHLGNASFKLTLY